MKYDDSCLRKKDIDSSFFEKRLEEESEMAAALLKRNWGDRYDQISVLCRAALREGGIASTQ